MPAILRRPEILGQRKTKRWAADNIDRRGLIRGAVSLGALGLLTGCDVSEEPPVQSWLRTVSAWNDGVQVDIPADAFGTDVRAVPGGQAAAL